MKAASAKTTPSVTCDSTPSSRDGALADADVLPLARRIASSVVRPVGVQWADAVQDACVAILEVRTQHDRPHVPYARWLWVRARGKVLDQYDAVMKRQSLPLERGVPCRDCAGEPHDFVAESDNRFDVRDAIERLKEPQRTVVRLYFLDGWTQADIAKRRRVGQPAVSEMLKRAKAALRRTLDTGEDD